MTKSRYASLENIREELDRCTFCAVCQAGCPTYQHSGSETLVARGKIRLAQAVMAGDLSLTERVANDFNQCLSCMNCSVACPAGVDTMAVFSAIRSEAHNERGGGIVEAFIFRYILPYPTRLNLLAKVVGFSSLFYKYAPGFLSKFFPYSAIGIRRINPNLLQKNLRASISEVNKVSFDTNKEPVKRIVYFSGCMTDLAFAKTGVKVVESLQKLGVEVVFPKAQVCCGAPAYYSGDMETARELAKKNVDALADIEADAIVYSCATCGSVIGNHYKKLLPNDAQAKLAAGKMIDFQKLLTELSVEQLFEDKKGAEKIKVTYHDPCHLKRGMGIDKEPRELLQSFPSVEFVEMEGADSCCGGAGTFGLQHYDMAMDQGKQKVTWIKKSGADVVATACPSCQLQLSDALNRFGHKIPVVHTADLVAAPFSTSKI